MSPLGIWLGSIVIRLVASRPAWVLGPLSPEWLLIAANELSEPAVGLCDAVVGYGR